MEEKISVIVPVYKVEPYLERCVNSILAQTYQNMEIILVDDGSPDNCPAICDEYAKKDSRIQVIHKKNGGLSSARNAGLDIATGEYIVFIDSDDYIESDMILELYKALIENHADMALCNLRWVDEEGKPQDNKTEYVLKGECMSVVSYWESYFSSDRIDFIVPYVVAWNKLYKKELWEALRYPEGKWNEDEYVLHKIIGQCICIADTLYVGYNYVQRENSIMSKIKKKVNFDCFDAWLDRIYYFLHIQKDDFARRQLGRYGAQLINQYHLCSNSEEKAVFQKYAKEYCSLYEQVYADKSIPMKERLKYFGFKKSPRLINIMMRMYVCIKG